MQIGKEVGVESTTTIGVILCTLSFASPESNSNTYFLCHTGYNVIMLCPTGKSEDVNTFVTGYFATV